MSLTLQGSQPIPSQAVVQHTLRQTPSALPQVQTYPNVLFCLLRWAWYGTLSTQAGAETSQVVRLTSLYDPDFTGAGDQPRFFDTLCGASGGTAPYSQFRVRKAHYRVGFMNNNSTAATACIGFVQPFLANAISATCSLEEYFSGLNLQTVLCSPNASNNMGGWIDGHVDIGKFLGVKDIEDDEDVVGGYNANPATNVHLKVGVRAQDDTTVGSIRVVIQVVYEAEFFSLNNAGES